MNARVWNLIYLDASSGKLVSDFRNPQTRRSAVDGALAISDRGWRVWVEHYTGKRIFESDAEIAHQIEVSALVKLTWGEQSGE